MLRYVIITIFIGMSFIHAENLPNLEKLKAEKEALVLKLESYSLKKKIIEIENFIENDKIQKEKRVERERALMQFKSALRANRNRVRHTRLVGR